ncbi:hypothetical protein Tco_1030444 [Tanacetum coccineum]|uniref:Uncharacterized protein n=1 Tax=Tanacetum coccineum TaxID=301880 RepID=A0ABQ5G682_9ASTR
MSNTNNINMQTQTSSALHNVIMEAGSKDRPPLLAPDKIETKDAVSSCSFSKEQEIQQFEENARLLKEEKHLTNEILHDIDCKTTLTKLRTMFENTFNSELRECLQNCIALETYSVKDTIIGDMDFIEKYMIETILHQKEIQKLLTKKKLLKENSNSETAFIKSAKESSLDFETKDVHAIKDKIEKAKERCMAYF